MVKNLPSSGGDTILILGQGTKIPHAVGQLSLSAAAREPMPRDHWACEPQLEKRRPSAAAKRKRITPSFVSLRVSRSSLTIQSF